VAVSSVELAPTMVELIDSRTVAESVIRELSLQITPEGFLESLSVEQVNDTRRFREPRFCAQHLCGAGYGGDVRHWPGILAEAPVVPVQTLQDLMPYANSRLATLLRAGEGSPTAPRVSQPYWICRSTCQQRRC
jgi:hypothetical protein